MRKTFIRGIDANKTERAMLSMTNAADTVAAINDANSDALCIKAKSSQHTRKSTDA